MPCYFVFYPDSDGNNLKGNGEQCGKGDTKELLLMHLILKGFFFLLMFKFCGYNISLKWRGVTGLVFLYHKSFHS